MQVLSYAVENLQAYLPSLASLKSESYEHLGPIAPWPSAWHQLWSAVGTPVSPVFAVQVDILKEFNFAQFLQGENNPHSVWLLKNGLTSQGGKVLKSLGYRLRSFMT